MGPTSSGELTEQRHTARLGERLRRVRQQQGLSLQEVEQLSGGRLKASVVGAYERGERAVSISRLQVLAQFYRVPVAELLPAPTEEREPPRTTEGPEVTIDLVAMEREREVEPAIRRYVRAIQHRRGDYNGRVLTVRAGDLELLAAVLDLAPDDLWGRLTDEGIVRH